MNYINTTLTSLFRLFAVSAFFAVEAIHFEHTGELKVGSHNLMLSVSVGCIRMSQKKIGIYSLIY